MEEGFGEEGEAGEDGNIAYCLLKFSYDFLIIYHRAFFSRLNHLSLWMNRIYKAAIYFLNEGEWDGGRWVG